ncbi:hypothetical protein BDQ17DRAFT_172870 [Cyathus striatus]|nr:hypothetical protein BDQ17DRAFT_172870 [Cyathus striatus]
MHLPRHFAVFVSIRSTLHTLLETRLNQAQVALPFLFYSFSSFSCLFPAASWIDGWMDEMYLLTQLYKMRSVIVICLSSPVVVLEQQKNNQRGNERTRISYLRLVQVADFSGSGIWLHYAQLEHRTHMFRIIWVLQQHAASTAVTLLRLTLRSQCTSITDWLGAMYASGRQNDSTLRPTHRSNMAGLKAVTASV